jgi:hypothetical protein
VLRIGVLAGAGDHDDVSRQLGPLGAVDWFTCADALVARVVESALDVVVTGLRDESGRSVAALVVELAARRPSLPVVLHTKLDRRTLDELLAVFAPGLPMECVVRPFAELAPMLHHVLSPFYRPGVAPVLLQHFVARAPASLATFLAAGALTAPERRSVEEVASWTRLSSRTIDRRLRRHGWASAHVVLRAFSALDAIWLMTEYGWSARLVQQVRRFPHPSSVTRLLATYAGTSPSTLVADGGFPAACDHVTHTLTRR